jgi:hypothetical protein
LGLRRAELVKKTRFPVRVHLLGGISQFPPGGVLLSKLPDFGAG